jgi:hypothetical protein
MANLITEKQKRVIKIDYLVRLYSVSIFICSLLGLFFLAYVVPYYFAVNKKDQIVAEQFKSFISAENKENIGESANQIVSQTLEEMRAVDLYEKNNFVPSVYFNKIIKNKNSSIEITKLSFSIFDKQQGQFLVSGVAQNREGLVKFIEDLKVKSGFIDIVSPVSDFAKDGDISFTLNIKITL